MIKHGQGNLLEADAEALVNTVNCVGVMGKGIALQFKRTFPQNFRAYSDACRRKEMKLGQVLVVPTEQTSNPLYIINFPTKGHWKSKSRLEDIRTGLLSLIDEISRLGIRSIAIPALGCGNGGLEWSEVKPLIQEAFTQLPNVGVLLYEPQETPESEATVGAANHPKMTPGRAAILTLLQHYQAISNELTMVAVQKLVYFFQAAGEPLKLPYSKGRYGPYSEPLHRVLQSMEGHYIQGYGSRSRKPSLTVLPEAAVRARLSLATTSDTNQRQEAVSRLIEGFESGYGMELLATVHWVSREGLWAASDADEAIEQVQSWSKRKRQRFQPDHIRKAWQRLYEEGWLTPKSG